MSKLLFIIIIAIASSHAKHKCTWEECPAHLEYTKYSDAWSIQQTHLEHPKYTYEQCEYVLNADGKDINY